MRSHPASTLLSAALLSIAALSKPASASDPVGGRADLTEAPASPQSATLSPDGRWFACTVGSDRGPARLLLCNTDGQRREVGGASDPAFAADSKSVIYWTASREGMGYVVRDLDTWTTKRSFRFTSSVTVTPDARHIVIKGPPGITGPDAGKRPSGTEELFIASLIEDRIIPIGPASLHELSSDGQFVALARTEPGGRVSLHVLRLGETEARLVHEFRGEVTALAWGDDHRSLALVIAQDKSDGGTVDLMVVVDDVTARTPRVGSIVPEAHTTWPRGAYLDSSAPRLGDGGAVVYFIVRSGSVAGPRRPRDDAVEIHRAADGTVYDSMTDSLKEGIPPTSGWLFAWIPAEGRIVKVADEDQASLVLLRGGRKVLVRRGDAISLSTSDPSPVEWDILDPSSGTRTSLGQRPVAGVSPSRTGRYVAYFDRGHWWAYDTKDGARRNLTATPGPSFEADLAMSRGGGGPITGVEWLENDRGLVAHDSHDAWLLHPDGTTPRRLTRGRERGRVYRLALTWGRDGAPPDGPYYYRVVETRSKHSGYVRVAVDGAEAIIAFGPWACDRLTKARDAERFVFQRESYDTPPNLFTVTARGDEPCPMTDIRMRNDTVSRPRRVLIQYRDRRGAELQGTLVYPVNYDSSKKYPMVVSIYRIRTDEHFRFRPTPAPFDDPLTYASRGYFVLLPDIVYQPREVGPSAVDCVESAVRAVLRSGLVDPGRIGLVGISLGGYETAFVLSKSKLFAAGVAASPPVDWANDFLIGRLGNVHSETAWLRSIGMTVPFWEDPDSYAANSLIYQAHGITTPLLIGIGRQDPVVDFRDGQSLFNLLRYLKRPAYLIAYPRGGHGLGDDFLARAQQFFDHYLKSEPSPDWITGLEHR